MKLNPGQWNAYCAGATDEKELRKRYYEAPEEYRAAIASHLFTHYRRDVEFFNIVKKIVKQRTRKQNRAIHKYCEMVADAMNDAGHCVQEVFTAPVDLSMENVKDGMFKKVMTALYPDIKSTADLTTTQVTDVYENVNRITAERYGISVPFPSEEHD